MAAPDPRRAPTVNTISADAAYASKNNIQRPGSQAAADAAEVVADALIEQREAPQTVAALEIIGNGEA